MPCDVWCPPLCVPQDFSDWSQCQVLELVSHYKPASEDEVFDFLNALEDRMTHTNSVRGGSRGGGWRGWGRSDPPRQSVTPPNVNPGRHRLNITRSSAISPHRRWCSPQSRLSCTSRSP